MNVFHYAHLGKLTGLGSIVSAVFCLLNDPLFKIVNNILDQDPFWVRPETTLKTFIFFS